LKTIRLWRDHPYRTVPETTDASYSLRGRCYYDKKTCPQTCCNVNRRYTQHRLRHSMMVSANYFLNLFYVRHIIVYSGRVILYIVLVISQKMSRLSPYWYSRWIIMRIKWLQGIYRSVCGGFVRIIWFWLERPVSPPLLTLKDGNRVKKEKTIVLDLDETLVHSTTRSTRGYDLKIEVFIERQACLFYVYKRPFVDYFIRRVSVIMI
jgi:hypothetical protein